VLDLLLLAGKPEEAKRIAAALPASDPKAKVYQIGGQPGPAAAKQLEAMIEQSADRGVKAVAYNMLATSTAATQRPRRMRYTLTCGGRVVQRRPARWRKPTAGWQPVRRTQGRERAKKYREKAGGSKLTFRRDPEALRRGALSRGERVPPQSLRVAAKQLDVTNLYACPSDATGSRFGMNSCPRSRYTRRQDCLDDGWVVQLLRLVDLVAAGTPPVW